ncbi:hypothetical protein K431DRAFT_284990 [Polychaeton citri CBS 116435]|uniref:White collar-2 n=1 Tax=Polychaeton citri CBS 116435 TaxID=1314669 RepID=A0A9P4UP47_9PEZI|nr:hypothetical protein K431DRAFT_284990 [Polychaeton citri CBS 116435]
MSGYYNSDGTSAQMANVMQSASGADMSMLDASMLGMDPSLNMDASLPMDLDTFGDFGNMDGIGGVTPQAAQQLQQSATGTGMLGDSSGDMQGNGGGLTLSGPGGSVNLGGGSMITGMPTQAETSAQQQAQNDPQGTMTGAGAGPLPTGFGVGAQINSTTLTEFTKRRNWSQRIIEELKDFLHILTPDGRILYVSPSCKVLTGHEPGSLIGKFITDYVHPDDGAIFLREFNESIASGNTLRFFYRFKKEDGTWIIFECDGHPHISQDSATQTLGIMSNEQNSGHGTPLSGSCRGFFMMARPYPTKNAALLDSFLEHKIENERLLKRIEELKREEREENAEQDRLYRDAQASPAYGGSVTPHQGATPMVETPNSRAQEGASDAQVPTPNYQGMPPPAKPSISNTALTRQNLDSALSAQKPDSIADKMSRYEASSNHLESIELLTGLRYRDGERSHGISTGDTSPALIRGDAGIAILLDRDRDAAGKKEKKKLKVADEYVCADCGTLDSPEWRKGPKGPKTLCNACGLRWAKKEKKRSGDDGGGKRDSPNPITGQQGNHTGISSNGFTPTLQRQSSSSGSMSVPMPQQQGLHGLGFPGGGQMGMTTSGQSPVMPMRHNSGGS